MRRKILTTTYCYMFLLIFLLFAGCTSHLKNFDITSPQNADEKKIPVVMALIVDDDTCQFTVSEKRQGNNRIFHIGPTICDNVSKLLPLVFEKVIIVNNADEAAAKKADTIARIRIIEASVVTRRRIPLTIDSLVVLELSVTDLDGRILYADTVKGAGQDARTFGGITPRLRASMQRCLNDLMQHLYEAIRTFPALQNISD